MSHFLADQLDYIFFLYGAAFLGLIPVSLFLRSRFSGQMAWTLLAWFGAAHGLNEWLDLLSLSLGSIPALDLARFLLLASSFVLLAEFGRASMAMLGVRVCGPWILAVLLGLAGLGGLAGIAGLFAVTRYVLGCGSGIWAAGAFFLASKHVRVGSRQFTAAAAFLLGYTFAAGLIPNAADFFPASWLNSDSFAAFTGFPIQSVRGVLALLTAVSLGLVVLASLEAQREPHVQSWFCHLLWASLAGLAIVWTGGWFLTQYLGSVADRALNYDFEHKVEVLHQTITEKMTEADNLARFLTESPEISLLLLGRTSKTGSRVDSILDRCSQTLGESICYVMDAQGLTLDSSNRHQPDSFVGQSYAFRPYFQQAMAGSPGRYWALGVTSKEMGYYASSPVRDQAGEVWGVAVVKRAFDEVRKIFPGKSPGLIIDPHGIIVMANQPDLVLRSLWPLSWQTRQQLLDSKQFGPGPFTPILARPPTDGGECRFQAERLRVFLKPAFWEDWSIVKLESMTPIIQARLLGISIATVLTVVLVGSFTVVGIRRDREEDFRQLFDKSVDMLILHDKGKIVAVNEPACTTLGYTRQELLRMSLFDIEVGIGIDDLLNLWNQSGVLTTLSGTYRRQDGSTFPVEVRAREISYQGRNLRLAAVRDVTERQRAEAALRESEQRFRDVAGNAQEWVWEVDAQGKYTYASPIIEKLLGYKPEEVLDKHFYDLFIPEDREELMLSVFVAFAEKRPLREFMHRNLHKDGSIVHLSTSGVPILAITGNLLGYRGADIDITERQKAEAALRQSQESYRHLASQLITVQEAERQRLARELHDDLTQRLAVLAMEASTLELELPAAGAEKIKKMREKLVKLSMDVHDLSRRLHPSILNDLGLSDAIASECASLRQYNGINANFLAQDVPPDLPKHLAINLYRIAQEALRNIAKHAGARQVEVTLHGIADTIHLTIQDDGQGIDSKGKKMTGLGLASMRERTSLIGGTFALLSQPGGGTVIEVAAPLTRRSS